MNNKRLITALAASLAACLPSLSLDEDPRVELVELRPVTPLELDADLELEFSDAVVLTGPGVRVSRSDGRDLIVELVQAGPTMLRARPVPSWPSDETLIVEVVDGLSDVSGRPVEPGAPHTRDTVRAPTLTRFSLAAPRPHAHAPPNLRTVVLTLEGALDGADVTLVGPSSTLNLDAELDADEGVLVAKIPGIVPSLELGATYSVEVVGAMPRSPAEASVTTGTVADTRAPSVAVRGVERGDGRLRVVIEADEPTIVRGALGTDEGFVPLASSAVPGQRVELRSRDRLAEGRRYAVRVEAEDLAGNVAEPMEVFVEMPGALAIEITELVPTPKHDWSDVGGVPFDATPGDGPVTSADEWIELVNRSERVLDLRDLELNLRVIDATPVEHALATAPSLMFGRGGDLSAWGVGEALVVRARGAMSQTDLRVELRWGEVVLDQIELSSAPTAQHAGGAPPDLAHESIAKDADGQWRWCEPSPGDPRPPRCLR